MNDSISFMQRALELASLALGRTSPNPVVGSIVVKDSKIIGEGYHKMAGTPHAEVLALEEAGEAAYGATLYVTLEPCDHKGKTPPCTQAIINAGISKVVVATLDPNPLVSGKGIKRLREAGIEVCTGLLEQEARELNEFFFKYITQGRPFVALKTAMSIDGKIATRNGDSRWVTNEKSRLYVHELRDTYDAILVGVGTILRDDPMLNTRLPKSDARSPVRLIIDGRLETPLSSQVIQTARKQKTIMYTCSRAEKARIEELKNLGVEVVVLGEQPGRIPLEEVFKDVAQKGIMSVLLESGGRINAYAVENKLVDKVYWFIAPKIIGGETAMSPVAGDGIDNMNNALLLKNTKVHSFDEDLLVVGYL